MNEPVTPPSYQLPAQPLPFFAMLRRVLSDPASVLPASIYDEWAVKLSGPGLPLAITDPDSVRRVLLDDGETFGRNRQLRRLMRRAWGGGLAAAEGESWAQQRRAAAPAFRPQSVGIATATMAEATRRMTADWQSGDIVDLGDALGRVVTRVVLDVLFSTPAGTPYDAVARDIPLVTREVTTFGLLDAMPLPDWLLNRLRGLGRSAEEARLRPLAAAIAAQARPPDARHHLPSMLRGVGPVADNTFGFMLAGFETTALGAAWAVYLLALHPELQDRLRNEAGDGLSEASFARQVAQEALRLYPPAPVLVRSAMRRTSLHGHRLWPGQTVMIPIFAIQRHRRLWDRPDHFDPARFGPDGSYDRGAYLPFGAGPRLCIAASFALAEIAVIVSELSRAFRFSPLRPPPEISLKVSTHSRNGLRVAVERV